MQSQERLLMMEIQVQIQVVDLAEVVGEATKLVKVVLVELMDMMVEMVLEAHPNVVVGEVVLLGLELLEVQVVQMEMAVLH